MGLKEEGKEGESTREKLNYLIVEKLVEQANQEEVIVHGIDTTISLVQPGEKGRRAGWRINLEIVGDISFALVLKKPPSHLLVTLSEVHLPAIGSLMATMQLDAIFIHETLVAYVSGIFKLVSNYLIATV